MVDRPQRIQLSRRKGWRMPPNTVSVARPGPFGNPYVVGKDGTAAECVELYKRLLCGYLCLTSKATIAAQRWALDNAAVRISELSGKNLACWCRAGHPCHADVLLELAIDRLDVRHGNIDRIGE
jgi:hypothetical protein